MEDPQLFLSLSLDLRICWREGVDCVTRCLCGLLVVVLDSDSVVGGLAMAGTTSRPPGRAAQRMRSRPRVVG